MKTLLKVAAHVAVVALLYLMFSFSLFLGLQVSPTLGNIGMVVSIGAVIAYVVLVRRRRSLRMTMEEEGS
ncbi:MAG: hypothetical protein OXI39_02295 [Gemmatimonadota bacterium]|uniref:hypothetical protein n=1 Tax=Candidatus Palauibacter scopulicola TaxID=3056741 RepID=UPI002383925A|nr:hypothetical protein [Candidatus Palauibacter scopulicola]MDE2661820.1 hypothetical protein [Candidatus Palauibacter scopulicola]